MKTKKQKTKSLKMVHEESDQKWEYANINEWEIKSRYGKGTATRVYIVKGTNRITYGWGVYECTVVKSIFKKAVGLST